MTMEHKQIFLKQIKEGVKNLKEEIKNLTPEQILPLGEKIAFFNEFYNLVDDEEVFDDYTTECRFVETEDILNKLYRFYKNTYVEPIAICYEDIIDVLDRFAYYNK